jgi:hypothetical protein
MIQPELSVIDDGTITYTFGVEPGYYDISLQYIGDSAPYHFEMSLRRVLVAGGIGSSGSVGYRRSVWLDDQRLVLINRHGVLSAIPQIEAAPLTHTLFIAGDSTVRDHKAEPWCGWGQMFPCFVGRGIAVANHADHGKTAYSFCREGLLDGILAKLKEKDYVFFQFGHNDQKCQGDFIKVYKESLRCCVQSIQNRGAIPLIVTPVQRGFFNSDGSIKDTLGDIPIAAWEVATQCGVDCIDLTKRSTEYLAQLGRDRARMIFVNAPAGQWPSYPDGIKSHSHHTMRGAYEMAKCVANELKQLAGPLSQFLEDVPPMNLSPGSWP